VLDDQFSNLDSNTWNHEVQVRLKKLDSLLTVHQINGFGTGSFDWTTNDPKNSYVDSQGLHIVPTLTTNSSSITMDQLLNG
jgi:hypothetical protein